MRHLINYFIARSVLTNVVMFGIIFSSIFFWWKIGKEQMPDVTMKSMRASIRYPGASSEDVELFITKPVEEKLKGITGLKEITSSSSYGSSSLRITFEASLEDIQEKIQEVKDAVDSVDLPKEADDPVYRRFKSSERAIIDIGVFLKNTKTLDIKSRIELQQYALALKNRMMSLKEVSGIDTSGYLRPELQIKVFPELLKKYEVSMEQVRNQITQQHVRSPIGSMKDKRESEITIISELDDIDPLENVIISSGFQGQRVRLKQIAAIEHGFEKSNSVLKIQGHEGVILKIKKSSSVDIITANKSITNFLEDFKKNNPESVISFVYIDDESYDVRNRLSLITVNGIVGFILILIVLFLFLDIKSGIWVAIGIPFSLSVTLMVAYIMGYTINNMTLAALIIVLGIVVDDAIIVAENITRKSNGDGHNGTAVASTEEMIGPIVGSILTTCAAFIPLYFFTGRFGLFVKYIPAVIFIMLFASFFESIFILPAHMAHPLPFQKYFSGGKFSLKRTQIINRAENFYAEVLRILLRYRVIIVLVLILLLCLGGYLFNVKMKYVMFPREESTDFSVKVIAVEDLNRHEMASKVNVIEKIFLDDKTGVVTSVRTSIGQSRRGGEVKENEASIRVEVLPPSERHIPLNVLIKKWQKMTDNVEGFAKVKFLKSRFGSDSGSPIVIEIQENNDVLRDKVARDLKQELEKFGNLNNIEIEEPRKKSEYRLEVKKDEVSSLGINYKQLSSTLRAYVEGEILYTLISGEEEVDIRFTGEDLKKSNISKILSLTVANKDNYLVPISELVHVKEGLKASNIQRVNFKRTTTIYADLAPGVKTTPLILAGEIEQKIFPKVTKGNPSTVLNFRGEVEDSRESESDFAVSIIMVLVIIYLLLVILFDSMFTPLLIAAIIPFGVLGVVLSFLAHGISSFGFFAVIGCLGMIGVVINDSIVLINKLEFENISYTNKLELFKHIASITSTRLRAVVVTTLTTVAGLFPTAYGIAGFDSMLAEMMLAMAWGLLFGMVITLVLTPVLYSFYLELKLWKRNI